MPDINNTSSPNGNATRVWTVLLCVLVLVASGTGYLLVGQITALQEQVALLVRLAFARMLARAGRIAPVILDDALVFTDDDRIERMFDALHRQAGDMQIIVLTCRQRAFRALGGQALRLQAVEA